MSEKILQTVVVLCIGIGCFIGGMNLGRTLEHRKWIDNYTELENRLRILAAQTEKQEASLDVLRVRLLEKGN